jgi:hypothetical protein
MPAFPRRLTRVSPLAVFGFNLALIGLAAAFSPLEKTLGAGVRLIYLHGVWVWTGLIAFGAAALMGLAALLSRRGDWHAISLALGRTGMTFWLTYLPMSLLVMQIYWGGLFLDEPRWRIPLTFGVVGLLLQAAWAVLAIPVLSSAGNAVYGAALLAATLRMQSVLHPDSPILTSDSQAIQFSFVLLLLLTLLAALQIAGWWRRLANPASGRGIQGETRR